MTWTKGKPSKLGGVEVYNGRNYDWLAIAKFIMQARKEGLDNKKIDEMLLESIGANTVIAWLDTFLASKTRNEALTNWGTKKSAEQALELFLPQFVKKEPEKKNPKPKAKKEEEFEVDPDKPEEVFTNPLNGEVKRIKATKGKVVVVKP